MLSKELAFFALEQIFGQGKAAVHTVLRAFVCFLAAVNQLWCSAVLTETSGLWLSQFDFDSVWVLLCSFTLTVDDV